MNRLSRFSVPILAELLLNFCVSMVLFRLLGRIADAASGAIGSVNSLFGLFHMFFLGLSQAGGIVIANACGRSNEALAARQRGLLLLIFLVAITAILLLVTLGRTFLIAQIMGLSGSSAEYAASFCRIAQWSLLIQALAQFMTAIFRSLGNSMLPFLIALLNNSVTLTLLWLLPDYSAALQISGVEWIALCQLSANLLALFSSILVFMLYMRAPVEFPTRSHFSRTELKAILLLAFAVVLEPVSYNLAQVVISRFFAEQGDVALAARAYAGTLAAVPSLLGIALGWGAQIQVSYLIGAGKLEDARNAVLRSCRLTIVVAPLFSLLIFLNSARLLSVFTADPAVADAASLLLGCFILLEIGRSCNTTIAPALKARGDAVYVARTAFIVMILVCLPVAWFLSFPLGLGILGLGLTAALDEMLRGWLNLKRWQK
ncbi:MAG: hypothetical protein CVV42_14065 [Candidatus Riflebacteria bacterium HGW-Riflebacteria-2]|jgi:Na+-driven multidrug efflux pump|nr:MAG: hypothetical protein CVV42_14065 [Candidatus Riflebacteria bacterium HGW-Riflebacteria-2]